MPLTVITVKTVPPSLRGDLTKWMQEIATGVYVGNFNSKVRDELWERVKQNVASGEATMSFAFRNEIGYQFETFRTQRRAVDYDGIPLVQLIHNQAPDVQTGAKKGFSDASKYRHARKSAVRELHRASEGTPYVILDIETDGLDEKKHTIIEIGAIRIAENQTEEFHSLILYDKELPQEIIALTGITNEELEKDGAPLAQVIYELLRFIENSIIIGYGVDFDCRFLNHELGKMDIDPLRNKVYDLMKFVKKEKKFLKNYRLETVLQAYEIDEKVPHRALEDARLIFDLSHKVNQFWRVLK